MRISTMVAGIMLMLLVGCSTTTMMDYRPPLQTKPTPRKLVIVFDGTGNDQGSRTNATRMYELIANQKRDDISIFYTEGVGTDGRVVGMLTGWGIGKDVREAYAFLAQRWRPNDEIYVIGFSRGAYAGRILTGLIYSAGIPRLEGVKGGGERFIHALFDAYKTPRSSGEKVRPHQARRTRRIDAALARWNVVTQRNVPIKAVAYWDTVEALGLPDRRGDAFEKNSRYVDQVCTVERAFHAVALDDNRVLSYTPILMTGPRQTELCPERAAEIDQIVDEVWFNGAHSDVGGGYTPGGRVEGHLSGVSLNWMIANLAQFDLLPQGAAVFEDEMDMIHDAERGSRLYQAAFDRKGRDVLRYAASTHYNGGRPRLHASVARRFEAWREMDRRFEAQCREKKPAGPRLLCARHLAAMPFHRSLSKAGCLDRLPGGGFRVQPRCATIVSNPQPQRPAARHAGGGEGGGPIGR
jgi:uncharacterized protein (DUF2235 family)